jgi:hypothetical protein
MQYLFLVCYFLWIIYLKLLKITKSIFRSHVNVFDMLYISYIVTSETNINNYNEFDRGKWLIPEGL